MRYEHGTLGAAKIDGCNCDACRAADRRYMNRRYRLMAYGQWQPYVDAAPVRDHVRRLQEFGVGWMTVARLSGVPRGSMSKLLYGDGPRGMAPSKRVRPATAAALLAIEPSMDVLADGAMVDGTGTRRRMQALVAIGWPQARLAERLGVDRTNLNKALRGDMPVRCRTARAARALYDELWDEPPPADGHREKIASNRARNYARDRGWVPPLAWDDDTIDDPAAVPDVGAETSRQDALFENCEELLRQGFTLRQVAERLGVAESYLQRVRVRGRRNLEAA
ncbi:sigma-70 family RNA polymerase sigma factor [Actinomadura decatromicini]|uniref:Sigma-70 family RNA polymerase sigma factor n=1 Tax=Actinomadura decatromicini TaxID=2604572 RepID=A0A5D3FBS4_9ACTN|nr:sigma-70 family RNA polymerase sigma factor [Actinomadura decatromicini]TYK45190.1 sigma-70 family RNA polymerase sigma factor [Actinomadura decatromicini]